MRLLGFAHIALIAGVAGAAVAAEDGYVSLFNGKTLDGWKVRGGDAKFSVKDGCIVGEGVPSDAWINTFITTVMEYGDFDLKVEFLCESGNSGVQFRSATRSEYDPQWDWNAFPRGYSKVFGYQAEITADGGCTGRLYDEERRGYRCDQTWLDFNTPTTRIQRAESSFRKGDWNEMRVVCEGPRIRTWLNGNPVADVLDDLSRSGFIGLQVHVQGAKKNGVEFKPMVVKFRNIRIRELVASCADAKVLRMDSAMASKAFRKDGTNELKVLDFDGRRVIRLNEFEIFDSSLSSGTGARE